MKISLTCTGTRPLLANNGQLANPINAYAQQLKQHTKKRTKTDEDLIAMMRIEARGGCYETADGLLAWPNEAIWRCIYEAGKATKRGEDIKRALRLDFGVVPLLINGTEVSCDEFLTDPTHIDYRSAVVSRRRVMRSRPLIADWSLVVPFDLDESMMDSRDLEPIVERAGHYVGMGNWRPTFGTFNGQITVE